MKLHCLLESQGAGAAVAAAARARGHEIVARVEDADAAYARTCTFDPWRTRALDLLSRADALGKATIPGPLAIELYDNKVAQARYLKPWAPETHVIQTVEEANRVLWSIEFPFISKAAVGAASQNVRLVRTRAEAEAEAEMALVGDGIPLAKGSARSPKPITMQRGYLLWQRFIPSPSDIRVVIAGDVAYGLRRFIRSPERPFASGSGKREIIRDMAGADVARSFRLANVIAEALCLRWVCFDFVQSVEGALVLELSFSWVERAYDECPLFDRATLKPTGGTAACWADLVVQEIERAAA